MGRQLVGDSPVCTLDGSENEHIAAYNDSQGNEEHKAEEKHCVGTN